MIEDSRHNLMTGNAKLAVFVEERQGLCIVAVKGSTTFMLEGLSFRRVTPCKDSRESDALVGEILEQKDERNVQGRS